MDELVTFSCPSCGANLDMEPGMQQVTCQYCGTTHILADLVSARSLTGIKADAARARLMRFFNFNMKDLEYNRQGKLSPHQKDYFLSQAFVAFEVLFAAGVGSTILIIVSPAAFHQPFLCSGIVMIVSMILGLRNYKSIIGPVKSGIVETEVGTLGKPEHINVWKPVIYIGRKTFPIRGDPRDDPFGVLAWDVPYKVYYSPAGNVILSIELVDA
jgi:hypothetical protein